MLRSRVLVGLALPVILAACSGGTDVNAREVLGHGIVAGQNQVTVAKANAPLQSAVIERLVRTRLGQLRMQRVSPAERLLDAFLPAKAWAQGGTVVTGSPVVGAVVCVSAGNGGLTPFVPCTNTDSTGHATFFFTPSTKAGQHTAEIRGTVNNEPAVFDTVIATVLPAAVDSNYRLPALALQSSPAVFPADGVRDAFGNGIPSFRIVTDGRLTVGDTVTGTEGARTVTFSSALVSNDAFTAELRGNGGVLVGRLFYRIGADQKIQWTACGVNVPVGGC